MQGTGPPGWELDAGLTTFLCKKNYGCEIQKVKAGLSASQEGTYVTESSKEDYGSKMTVFSMMMMMMMIERSRSGLSSPGILVPTPVNITLWV
jgi:hypothetical protein